MAPKKRKTPKPPQPAMPVRVTRFAARSAERVTRSFAKRTGFVGLIGSVESDRKTKKLKRAVKGKQKKQEGGSDDQAQGGSSSNASNNTIVIEHSTQGNLLKTRATEVEQGLHEKVDGINVKLNPKMSRKCCFEIRAEGGEKFIGLLRMKRPYKRLKDLDRDKVISDIIDNIN